MGLSLLVGFISIQEPLVTLPYTITRHRQTRTTPQIHAGDTLAQFCLFSILVFLLLGMSGIGLLLTGAMPDIAPIILTLAIVMPFVLLREFSRQFAFAQLSLSQPLILDVVVAVLQVLGLTWLAYTGQLTATTACAVIGVACAAASVGWLYLAWDQFSFGGNRRVDRIVATSMENWRLGKWLFATQLTAAIKGYLIYWLLAVLCGVVATGVYAACMTIALVTNPLVLGLANILTPRASLALSKGGEKQLWHECVWDSVLLGAAMSVIYAAVVYGGEDAVRLLFPHQQYQGQGTTIAVLALALFASALGLPPASALTSLERPRDVFLTGLYGALITLLVASFLVRDYGVLGAAFAGLVGGVISSVGRWTMLFVVVARSRSDQVQSSDGPSPDRKQVAKVLDQFATIPPDRDLMIEQIGVGREAIVYVAYDANDRTIWPTHHRVIVKLYKPVAGLTIERVLGQHQALIQLHRAINERTFNGWQISTPKPLYVCRSPLALVMTAVSGEPLSSCLNFDETVPTEILDSMPLAIVNAMDTRWAEGSSHGDLQLHNILCNIPARELAFLDADINPDNGERLLGPDKRWHAAAHDLADLVYEASVTILNPLSRPGMRMGQQRFTATILQAAINMAGSAEQQHMLLDAVATLAHQKVEFHVRPSRSIAGLWHVVLRQFAVRRIDAIVCWQRNIIGGPRSQQCSHSLAPTAVISTPVSSNLPAISERALPPHTVATDDGTSGLGLALQSVFNTLDRAGIGYCVLHGYEDYPWHIKSDVDIVISQGVSPIQLATLFHNTSGQNGTYVVQFSELHFVLALKHSRSPTVFLHLDMSVDCEARGLFIYSGRDLIANRRRYGQFWVPTASLEFICYLARKIIKRQLDTNHTQRLSDLYREDPMGCQHQLNQFWGKDSASRIANAAATGSWQTVLEALDALRTEVELRAISRHPWRIVKSQWHTFRSRIGRLWRPECGLTIVLLGPDGAGKSSVVRAINDELAGAFTGTTCHRFPPGVINQLFHTPQGTETEPHATPPRSPLTSVTRAVLYWGVFYATWYRLKARFALARGRLLIHDRHLVDAIIDPKRYRYGGPTWILRLIWRVVPGPDMVIVLDAPPDVIQARKQEVPFVETARQRHAYLSLVEAMPNGHIVDASRPLPQVIDQVRKLILSELAARVVLRCGQRAKAVPKLDIEAAF
jgi:thymidylate kinase/O-antigen/teichoic acid export membrane protein